MFDLVEMFDSLQPPLSSSDHIARFTAQLIPGYNKHRLAKDSNGKPSILISVPDKNEKNRPAPIKLENVSIQFDVNCSVSQLNGMSEEGNFTIVGCTGIDETLHTYFLHIMSILVTSIGADPIYKDVIRIIHSFVELFRTMSEAPQKSTQGLWAELFLIARSSEISTMIEAWHTTPNDRYDFCWGDQQVEVKSSLKRIRQHHFSLEQLQPPENTKLLIASIYIEYAGIGMTIMDLVEQIRKRVGNDPKLLLKVDKLIASTLGQNWRSALDLQFDIELAESSLLFFEVSTIPTVEHNLPKGVNDVHFKSDLTDCSPIDIQHYKVQKDLFYAALYPIIPKHNKKVLKKSRI